MTYFIGIDVAKYKHNCFIMDQDGFVIRDSFSFSNDRAEPVLTCFFLSWILWILAETNPENMHITDIR